MLNVLFNLADFAAQGIISRLHLLIGFLDIGIGFALLFDFSFKGTRRGNAGFQLDLQFTNDLLGLVNFGIEIPPADGIKLCLRIAFLLFILFIAFRSPGLALQVLQLTLQLFPDIGKTLQVLAGTFDTVFRLPAPFLVFGDAGCFFDKDT